MVTGLLNQYNAATSNQQFIETVEMAVQNAAQAIATEGTSVANHANRAALAKAVSQPGAAAGYAMAFALLIAAQDIDMTSTDTAIQNMVNSVWNCVAGAP